MTTLHLPWPPSVNHYYVRTRVGMAIGKKGRDYRLAVLAVARTKKVRPLDGWLRVYIELYPPDDRIRDIDNIKKCLYDACTKANVWFDDSQIRREVTIFFGKDCIGCKKGLVSINVTTIGDGLMKVLHLPKKSWVSL